MVNDRDYAVVIGVSHYQGLTTLMGSCEDARQFHAWLLSPDGGGVPRENSKLVLSQQDPLQPIQDDIDDKFSEILMDLRGRSTSARRLYFYFSGHGLGINWADTAMVLPKWSDLMRGYALSSDGYLSTLIEGGFFEEIFFFLDCCRNRIPGVQVAEPNFGNVKPSQKTATCDSLVFYSTEFDNAAYEAELASATGTSLDNNLVRGMFTVALLDGLRGGAARNGVVSVNSLIDFLDSYLAELSEKNGRTQVARHLKNMQRSDKPILELRPTLVTVHISFKDPGRTVVVEDGHLQVIKRGLTDSNPWTLRLAPGIYSIGYDGDNLSFEVIRVTGSQNPLDYAF